MALTWIDFAFPGVPGVRCVFQTRQSGNSCGAWSCGNISLEVGDDPASAISNRRQIAPDLGLTEWAELKQVHGDRIAFEPVPQAPDTAPVDEGDGLATARAGLGLVIKTADCQPVLIAHRLGHHVAALHVGWRGNRIGFIASGIRAFCHRYGLAPRDLLAVRGPSLGPALSEFVNFEGEWGDDFRHWFNQRDRTMNLWGLTRTQLEAAGLASENIFSLDLCTHSLVDSFFSYRRERTTGRQASVIWIKPPAAQA